MTTPAIFNQCHALYLHHEVQRLTLAECARSLDMSDYAVRALKKSAEYLQLRQQFRDERRDQAIERLHGMADDALDVLHQLATSDRSGFVRFNAAKTILDYIGIGASVNTEVADDRGELSDFLKEFLTKAQVTVTIDATATAQSTPFPQVTKGGLLPEFPETGWTPRN